MIVSKKALQVVNIPFVLPYFFGDQINFLKENNVNTYIACSSGEELDVFCEKYRISKFELAIVRKIDLWTDLISLIKLTLFIRREKFQYVCGHTPKGALLSMLAAKIAGVKHRVYFRHGIVFETSVGFKLKLMLLLERLTCICATKVVSVSKSVEAVSDKLNVSPQRKSVLLNKGTCNGVDANRFRSQRNDASKIDVKCDFVVGFVGRLVNDKGINELIDAWKIVLKSIPTAKLLLVGPYEERDSLSQNTKEYIESSPSIVFTGLVNDTVKLYEEMDIFILPSYREGFPTVVLEASLMELPIITTRSTGCVDSIVENHTGIFTEIEPTSIAESILYYYKNPALRRAHGISGRAWVKENFNQTIVWEHLLKKVYS